MLKEILEFLGESSLPALPDGSVAAERFQRNRKRIAVLSALGLLDSGYLFLYQTGKVRHLWCPGFGGACDRIAASPRAYQGRIPDSLLGAAGYAALLGLALAGDKERYRTRPLLPRLMGGGALAALGLSALLTYVQKKEFDDFCFWCLVSAAISTLTVPLAMPEFLATFQRDSKSKINVPLAFRSSTSVPGE
ncbi:MAG: hypothetical protein HY647_13555 [Acidobacteria bacterium]|nr:hypothetical protein [Acidobacteriota bacterium]